MNFKDFLELKLPHVNDLGHQYADKLKLTRGKTTAMNQLDTNCYEIASKLAMHFGFKPASADEIRNIRDKFKVYWMQKKSNPTISPPILPKPGEANFVYREGDEFMGHVSFEYRGKEYNYGSANVDGFKILFKIPLEKINQQS